MNYSKNENEFLEKKNEIGLITDIKKMKIES